MPASALHPTATLLALASACGLGGCVQRTIRVTSEPPGALVWLNDREIGRTPVDVEFLHYGTYDVRLVRDGFEPMLTSGDAVPPLWDNVPLDFVAEILPIPFESTVEWHYDLEPLPADPAALRADLVERANEARVRTTDDDRP